MIKFFRACLTSYGIVAFAPHPLPSFFLMLATFYHPLAGVMGLIGNMASNLMARWLHPNRLVWESGIFGVNGILIGLALAKYADPSFRTFVFLLVGAGMTGILSVALAGFFAKFDLPVLSIPFMAMVWLILLIIGSAGDTQTTLTAIPFLKSIDLWVFDTFPLAVFEFLKMFGSILFQDNLISGLMALLAIGSYSRISIISGLWGGVLGMGVYIFIHGSLAGFHGLNFVLIALAMGGFFVVLNLHSFWLMSLAVVMVGMVEAGMENLLAPIYLPVLVFPFNVVTVLLLYPLKNIPGDSLRKIIPVPLYLIKSPESNLRWYHRWSGQSTRQFTVLTFPFLGEWSVLQGNDGEWTHKDKGKYAWDFVVRDEEGQQARGFGNRLEDFYAYGLPVLAPAPGTIYAVVNTVDDNPPQTANTEQNWGNYVIIDHHNGEYSELSHFKQGSITVAPGQYVQRGQILGYCGNSGRSPVPHIHFQLQNAPVTGAVSLPTKFSEGMINGKSATHILPQTDDKVSAIEVTPEETWTLLGKESITWVFQARKSFYRFRECLKFSTDEYGLPAIISRDNRLWRIVDMPHFMEVRPDFKTYPSLLSPSVWIEIVGEGLILPKVLMDGFEWNGGKVTRNPGEWHRWSIRTGSLTIRLDTRRGVIESVEVADKNLDFTLHEVRQEKK